VLAVSGGLAMRAAAQDRSGALSRESLIENLKAKNVEARRSAANEIRMSDRKVQCAALPVMIDLLKTEKDGQVRLAVLDTVTALGHDATAAVPALVHTLRTGYGGQREEELHQDYRSALALAAVGKPAVLGLRSLLGESKETVRAEVVMALGRIGPDAEPAIPDLVRLLGDKYEPVRREAALALGRIGKSAVESLIVAAGNKEPTVRARAVESLGYLTGPDERVLSAVLKSTHDAAREVRAAGVKSLAKIGQSDEVLLPIVKKSVRQEDENVRLAVVDLLVQRRALLKRSASDLEALLTAKSDGVSRHAAFLLGKLGPQAVPRLLDALRHEQSRVDQIADALAQSGRPVTDILTRALKAPEPRLRQGAALALGQIRPIAPGAARSLTDGLHDPDNGVKAACLTAIGCLGPRAAESVPAVRSMLRDESARIRIKAIEVLAQSAPRDERLLADFRPLLDDADPHVQRRAIDAIRSLGPLGRIALADLIGKLASTNPEVRLAAVELIGSHGEAAAEAVPALASLLDDRTPEVRVIAAQALGKLGKAAQPAFDRLTSLLGAEQVEVREAAALTLGSLELDALVIRPHLAKALRDDKPEVRRAAIRAIQRLGPQAAIFVPDIILLAEGKENQRSVERLLRRFERRGPDARSLPELIKQLEHNKDSVRLLAIKFLGLAGGSAKGALPVLERMREDPSALVRKQAEAASKQIKNDGASSKQPERGRQESTTR
jgi:HEAT repeat protein